MSKSKNPKPTPVRLHLAQRLAAVEGALLAAQAALAANQTAVAEMAAKVKQLEGRQSSVLIR